MSRTARRVLAAALVVASVGVAAPAASALDECVEIVVHGPVIAVCRPF
jgi:hypothetical protein